MGRDSRRHLVAYACKIDALRGAVAAKQFYGDAMSPYQCPRCGQWHLTPSERQTPQKPSQCLGKEGTPKAAYVTEGGAQRRAYIIWRERRVTLRVYRCDICDAWHLTSCW